VFVSFLVAALEWHVDLHLEASIDRDLLLTLVRIGGGRTARLGAYGPSSELTIASLCSVATSRHGHSGPYVDASPRSAQGGVVYRVKRAAAMRRIRDRLSATRQCPAGALA
jgi:hypothetical protein